MNKLLISANMKDIIYKRFLIRQVTEPQKYDIYYIASDGLWRIPLELTFKFYDFPLSITSCKDIINTFLLINKLLTH